MVTGYGDTLLLRNLERLQNYNYLFVTVFIIIISVGLYIILLLCNYVTYSKKKPSE